MNKVGRPVKHTDKNEYQEIRKEQYKVSKRKCRKKKKLMEEIELMTSSQFNKKYQTDLMNYINQYDFDYFFTGTIDLTKMEKKELWNTNQQIDLDNQEFEIETGYVIERKVGIWSLRRYTEKYINFLNQLNLLKRSFVVFEIGKNNNYHVHILFQSNPNKINLEKITENLWLMGNSITLPINETDTNRTKLIGYCLKELKPTSSKISDMNKVDNWFISGDFSIQKKENDIIQEVVFPFLVL